MEQVSTCPVQHGHEVIADAVDTLGSEVTERLLIYFYLLVAVRTAIFDGLYYWQRLYHTPTHAVALNVFTQVVNLLTCPYLAEGYIVQSGNDALNTNLSQLCKRNLVFLAKPSPCSFHSLLFLMNNLYF